MGLGIIGALLLMGISEGRTASPKNRPIDVQHYALQLEIDPGADPKKFDATVTIDLIAKRDLNRFTLDQRELHTREVQALTPKEENVKFTSDKEELTVHLNPPLKKGEKASFRIAYQGVIRNDHHGLFRVKDPDDPSRGPILATQLEADHARELFPCNDEPNDKATTEIRVTLPESYEVISNGIRGQDKKLTRSGVKLKTVHWKMEKPHSVYLVSLAIGKFALTTKKYRNIELSFWVSPSKVAKTHYLMQATEKSMELLESYLAVPYPWPKYATVGIPTFFWGGMENTSSTHMNEEAVLLNDPLSEFEKNTITSLVAHELAHQWFGNLVTLNWWQDLWLNESFATYLESLITQRIFGTEEQEINMVLETWQDYFRQEDGPRSHPIVTAKLDSIDDAFDDISYTKGGHVLRMLNFHIGESAFRKGLKTYLTKYAYSNATHVELFKAMEEAAGEDLTKFQTCWVLQRGYPLVEYSGRWSEPSKRYTLHLSQRSNHPKDKTDFYYRLPVTYHRKAAPAYEIQKSIEISGTKTNFELNLPAAPEWVTINPRAIALIKLTPKNLSADQLVAQATHDPDEISRMWANLTLLQGLLEGGESPVEAQRSVLENLKKDPSPYVRMGILSSLQKTQARWLPSELGGGLLTLAQESLQPRFESSPLFRADPHGWRQFRSQILASLGKVNDPSVLPLLAEQLKNSKLPLDDLTSSTSAVAKQGTEQSMALLKGALALHGDRGYRFRFRILLAFAAFENPIAAKEIREIVKTEAPDLVGKLGYRIRDNFTLRDSKEWARTLETILLKDSKFGEEIQARLMTSIEESKTPEVKHLLRAVAKNSDSERIRMGSKKILEKNF